MGKNRWKWTWHFKKIIKLPSKIGWPKVTRSRTNLSLTGTARYASINAHRGTCKKWHRCLKEIYRCQKNLQYATILDVSRSLNCKHHRVVHIEDNMSDTTDVSWQGAWPVYQNHCWEAYKVLSHIYFDIFWDILGLRGMSKKRHQKLNWDILSVSAGNDGIVHHLQCVQICVPGIEQSRRDDLEAHTVEQYVWETMESDKSMLSLFTKASLLAGVCFPLGMYWGQSFWSRSDLSHRNVPFKWFNHLILTPPRRVQLPVGPWSSELFWITVSWACA